MNSNTQVGSCGYLAKLSDDDLRWLINHVARFKTRSRELHEVLWTALQHEVERRDACEMNGQPIPEAAALHVAPLLPLKGEALGDCLQSICILHHAAQTRVDVQNFLWTPMAWVTGVCRSRLKDQ